MTRNIVVSTPINMRTTENRDAINKAKANMTYEELIAGKGKVSLINIKGERVTTIMRLGNPGFTDAERDAVERLIPYAQRKPFVRDLLLNGFNRSYKVDIGSVIRYTSGETEESTYFKDLHVFFKCLMRGLETHKIIGDVIYDLVDDWKEDQRG